MIKEKKQCIKFQRAKAAEVKKFCDIEYHTKEDEKAIKKMDDEKFLKAWEDLKGYVFSDSMIGAGLVAYVCIFCLYHYDESDNDLDYCHNCAYGKNHGICAMPVSDWRKILKGMYYLATQPFPNKFYRDLLNKIMEEKT